MDYTDYSDRNAPCKIRVLYSAMVERTTVQELRAGYRGCSQPGSIADSDCSIVKWPLRRTACSTLDIQSEKLTIRAEFADKANRECPFLVTRYRA